LGFDSLLKALAAVPQPGSVSQDHDVLFIHPNIPFLHIGKLIVYDHRADDKKYRNGELNDNQRAADPFASHAGF